MLIANHTYEEQINTIRQVLQIANENKLWFNTHECQFMPYKLAMLLDFLTELGSEADPNKVNTIQQLPKPANRRQLQRCLGMVNYLSQCCAELAAAATPLSELHGSTKQ